MSRFYRLVWPALRCLDPEAAHRLAVFALKRRLVPTPTAHDDASLRQRLWGLDFANPIGLAAGFDKDAEVAGAMLDQGFGFVETGTVTPLPQPGNPKPRVFRLARDRAVINRLGFNSLGANAVARNLGRLVRRSGPVGVNLGKNATSAAAARDYAAGARAFARLADYLVVNVSSPNTPGLRALQSRDTLAALLDAVLTALAEASPANPPPLLLKVAPDLTDDDKRDIAAVAVDKKLAGLIATNTTVARAPTLTDPKAGEQGGLSGQPLFEPSTWVLADFYRLTRGRMPLIGVGGVASGAQAYAKIRAGASLVQIYTALVFDGPGIVTRIKRELAECLRRDGFATVGDAVGADHR